MTTSNNSTVTSAKQPKKNFEKILFFNYFSSHETEEDDNNKHLVIKLYGITENYKNIYVRIDDFPLYMYLELPNNIEWTDNRINILKFHFSNISKHSNFKPVFQDFQKRKKVYDFQMKFNGEKYVDVLHPFLFICFRSEHAIRYFSKIMENPVTIEGIGKNLLFTPCISNWSDDPLLKFFSASNLPTIGWIEGKGILKDKEKYESSWELEYLCNYTSLKKSDCKTTVIPRTLTFDIETYSHNKNTMPDMTHPKDVVFQISYVINDMLYDNDKKIWYERIRKNILVIGECDKIVLDEDDGGDKDIEIINCKNEKDLIMTFAKRVREEKPNILSGYNIFGYDINYLYGRAKYASISNNLCNLGCISRNTNRVRDFILSTNAYGKNKMYMFEGIDGVAQIDLLPYIRKNFKYDTYSLDNVAKENKIAQKDPLKHYDLFRLYENHDSKSTSVVGKYCIRDSLITYQLFKKMTIWFGMCEAATVQNIQLQALITQGVQIGIYSMVFKFCLHNNYVYQPSPRNEMEPYSGATVIVPKSGLYSDVYSFDFCLAGNTLISLSNGNSVKINNMINGDVLVLAYKTNNEIDDSYFVNGLQYKGKRETVNVWLNDGTVITCTPDHKFMLDNEKWCKAIDLKGKNVISGIEYPEDKIYENEKTFELELDGMKLTMDTYKNREKTLAFARMLGYILTDGSIYLSHEHDRIRKCAEVSLGTVYDTINFLRDIKLFVNKEISYRKRTRGDKGTTYNISIPQELANLIHSVDNIIVGKRSTQPMELPSFILNENCPLSIIKQFLSGLFGGDGSAPCYSKSDNKFGSISFKWTTIEKYKSEMEKTMINIVNLLLKFNLSGKLHNPIKIKYGDNSIKPKDYLENPRWDYQINLLESDSLEFHNNIGFKYCINKTLRLNVVSSYQKMCNKVREQHNKIFKNTLNIIQTKKCITREALEISRKELLEQEPFLHDIVKSSVVDIGYRKHEEIRHADKPKKMSLSPKKFIQPLQYLKETNTINWFNTDGNKTYGVDSDDIYAPSYIRKVIDVRKGNIEEVYDIEVAYHHNFVANGIVVSNCSLYPSIIQAYNICVSTFVTDKSIPDKDCHCLHIEEHSNCEHDEKIIKKEEVKKQKELIRLEKNKDKPEKPKKERVLKPKLIKCGNYDFRFIKTEVGGKGIIPTLIKNLLDARKSVRNEIKQLEKERYQPNIPDDRKNDIDLALQVLNSRQLSYKVSANSMYGAFGTKKGGYIPFYQGAMSVTYIGRTSLQKVRDYVPSVYPGTKIVYGDSVGENMPILIRRRISFVEQSERRAPLNNKFIIKYIEIKDLVLDEEKYDDYGEKQSAIIKNVDVWSDKGWTPIKHCIRHKIKKQMYRVCTPHSFVDVTEDHSMLLKNGVEIPPHHTYGQELLTNEHPIIEFEENYNPKFNDYIETCKSLSYLRSYNRYLNISHNETNGQITFVMGNNTVPEIVNKIIAFNYTGKYVYDLETENHHFSAGVGNLVVHNTDSVFLRFSHLEGKSNEEAFKFCYSLSDELKKLFLAPMQMDFEGKKYKRFLILAKKMYMIIPEEKDGTVKETKSKGLCTARRDNCSLLRTIYEKLGTRIMNEIIPTNGDDSKLNINKNVIQDILYSLNNDILSLFTHYNVNTKKPLSLKDLVIVKTLKKDTQDYKSKTPPGHVELANRMIKRGVPVPTNTRIQYLFITNIDNTVKQGGRVEELEYYENHKYQYSIDYLYYLEKQLMNPIDALLKTGCNISNYLFDLWRYHSMKYNLNRHIIDLFNPIKIYDEDNNPIIIRKKIPRPKKVKLYDENGNEIIPIKVTKTKKKKTKSK